MCLATKGDQVTINLAKCAAAQHCLGDPIPMEKSLAIPIEDPRQCLEEKCPDQWKNCKADPKCFQTLMNCEKKCGHDISCMKNCLAKEGNQHAIDLFKCGEDKKCFANF